MPANIEIKARARDFDAIKSRAEKISDTPVETIRQEDIFFNASRGRLKLRVLAPNHAELIYYERFDRSGPKRSDYHIAATSRPDALKRVLELAYGIRGVVRKTRYLYMTGQTRVHLDDVEGLGRFLELEVVLREDQSDEEGQAIAEKLMKELGIETSDLLEGAYMDMLEKQ
jgi:predicted adenylyl cyclase CyaB